MPNVKGMRWQTAVAVVQQGVQAHIAIRRAEADRGEEFLSFLGQVNPPAKARVVGITHIRQGKGMGRSGKPQPGSIPDRVLEIVSEFDGPVAMADILAAKHGARHYSVTLAVRELVKSGHLVATGATTQRRYALAGLKTGRPA
jgi:hypothetical protein